MLDITEKQKSIIEQVINVFETGSRWGNYASIALLNDGPNGMRQVTYGRSQTTEFGNLSKLVDSYIDSSGRYAKELEEYLPKIGKNPLSQDTRFLSLLKLAGTSDPIMAKVQDRFFDENYFQPALKWAEVHGFLKPLSLLVVYDSFIHSGGVPKFLRDKFPEKVPEDGGTENDWIKAYIATREKWLATHKNKILHPTVYRMKCLKKQIELNNWNLDVLPIETQGLKITGDPRAT